MGIVPGRNTKKIKQNLIGYSFILPNLAGVIIFTVVPVVLTMLISFTDWDYTARLLDVRWIGLENFARMWKDRWFLAALRNTLLYSFVTVPATIFIALVFALLVNSFVRYKGLTRLCLFLPYVTNLVVVCYIWKIMLSRNGIITQLVRFLGAENPPIWLANSQWALPSLMMISVWINVGYVFVLYQAALSSIDNDLYEAAIIDGASWLKRSTRITIPLLSPTTFFILITQLIFSFRMFDQVQILTQGGPGMATTVLAHYIYVSAFSFYKMGYASSMTWILFLIIFTVTVIQWKGQKKWTDIS